MPSDTTQIGANATDRRADPGLRVHREKLVERAKKELRQAATTAEELFDLGKKLKDAGLFDFACRILALAREKRTHDDLRVMLAQQLAICTYKNPDVPAMDRLDEALAILQQEVDLLKDPDQESLGIAGSIFKKKWETDGRKEHLETSLEYYRRGHEQGVTLSDLGYTGINAAFVLDLLADIEDRHARATGALTSPARAHAQRAFEIRGAIAATLEKLIGTHPERKLGASWWVVATLVEAYFGRREYDEAERWLKKAQELHVDPWQFDATAQQLAWLARVQMSGVVHGVPGGTEPPTAEPPVEAVDFQRMRPWEVLRLLGLPKDAREGAALGKIGLALSGGGFRASLFHIGVLATLAEYDLLRHVEVLSCVSGGSIVGTYYYLELRQHLQTVPDEEVRPADYVEIVRRVAARFLAGVQQNVRMRAFSNAWLNWRMFFSRDYSRTHRIGELYESLLFSRVLDGTKPEDPRFINDVEIHPRGAPPQFHPRQGNWRRNAKVPLLVVNATTLNTGHQWQFTASFMGEPASAINTKVNANYRLRRMYYGEAPEGYRRMRLGHAVGASSCVPGIFEPLQFRNLFPGLSVALVDGGIHDNQGVVGLQEQGCQNLIISDASGQMGEEDYPPAGLLSVLTRSDLVLQERVRDVQLRDLDGRARSRAVTTTFVHLKNGLDVTPRDWIGCDDPKQNPAASSQAVSFTPYGVRKDVQRLLASLRTDLDSFCDAEAYALMTSAYLMMDRALSDRGLKPVLGQLGPETWEFLKIEPAMRRGDPRLMEILRAGRSLAFKVWMLVPRLRIAKRVLQVAGAVAFIALAVLLWSRPLLTVGGLVLPLLVAAIAARLGPTVGGVLKFRERLQRIALGVAASLVGSLVVAVHLRWFDRWYLDYGRLRHFVPDATRGTAASQPPAA